MNRNQNIRPLRGSVGNIAGTADWYLVISPRGKQVPVRGMDLNGRQPVQGPYETRTQAMNERGAGCFTCGSNSHSDSYCEAIHAAAAAMFPAQEVK